MTRATYSNRGTEGSHGEPDRAEEQNPAFSEGSGVAQPLVADDDTTPTVCLSCAGEHLYSRSSTYRLGKMAVVCADCGYEFRD